METGQITGFFSQATYWPARFQDKKMRYDFPYLVRWAVSSKNMLFVGSAVDYEISVMNFQGNLEFKFKKDDKFNGLEMLQKVIDDYSKKIEEVAAAKEKEILER